MAGLDHRMPISQLVTLLRSDPVLRANPIMLGQQLDYHYGRYQSGYTDRASFVDALCDFIPGGRAKITMLVRQATQYSAGSGSGGIEVVSSSHYASSSSSASQPTTASASFEGLLSEALGMSTGGGGSSPAAKPEVPSPPPQLYNLRLEPDLKALCRKVGLRLGGRKGEVLQRLLLAWQNDAPNARATIRAELGLEPAAPPAPAAHRATSSSSCAALGGGGGSSSSSSKVVVEDAAAAPGGGGGANGGGSSSGGARVRCLCTNLPGAGAGPTATCVECGCAVHLQCVDLLGVGRRPPPPEQILCPHCTAATIAPFAPGAVEHPAFKAKLKFVYPASPLQLSHAVPPNQMTFDFIVPASLADHEPSAGATAARVELRCFLSKTLTSFERRSIRWPLQSRLFLNGREILVPQQPQAWDGHAYKDRNEDMPLVLSRPGLDGVRAGRNHLFLTSYDALDHIAVRPHQHRHTHPHRSRCRYQSSRTRVCHRRRCYWRARRARRRSWSSKCRASTPRSPRPRSLT